MPEHRRGHLHDLHAAQPRRRDESGQVGHRSPAEADDRVRAREVGLAHDLPAERRDLDALALLGVRDLREQHLASRAAERARAAARPAALSVGGWTTSTLRAAGGKRLADAVQDAAADGDVVAGVAGDRDRRRLGHACCSASSRPRDDRVDHGLQRPARRVEGHVGDLVVQAAPRRHDALPARDRVVVLQKRPRRVADASGDDPRLDRSRTTRCAPGRRASPHPAPPRRRATTTPPVASAADHGRPLERAEVRLRRARRRSARDRAVLAHDALCRCRRRDAERPGDAAADARLARAHRPDQDEARYRARSCSMRAGSLALFVRSVSGIAAR